MQPMTHSEREHLARPLLVLIAQAALAALGSLA
jgi:hypothetical protein